MSEGHEDAPALPGDLEVFDSDSAKSLGQLLVKLRKIDPEDVEKVLRKQAELKCSFGKAAVALKLVKHDDIIEALSRQYQYPTHYSSPQFQRASRELIVGREPFGQDAEEIRRIRTAILQACMTDGRRSIAIIGVNRRAGATYFAANLALAMAQMTLPTVLVETNMRFPRLGAVWGIQQRGRGLAEWLRHQEIEPSVVIREIVPNLSLLLSGAEPPNPQELLGSPRFDVLRQRLEEEYAFVLYDTASATEYADALVVGANVGAAIVIARRHRTRFHRTSRTVESLRNVGCDVLGTILNRH